MSTSRGIGTRPRTHQFDAIDERLVELLVEDGRMTYVALGADVSLSVPAVKRRVDRLRDTGAIRAFTTVVDHSRFGWPLEVFVMLYTRGVCKVDEMRARLERLPEVIEAMTVAGPGDTMVRVVARDTDHLEEVVGALRGFPHVERTESTVVMTHLVDIRLRAAQPARLPQP